MRRGLVLPVILTLAVLGSAPFWIPSPGSPVGQDLPSGLGFEKCLGWVVLSPVCQILDVFTVLSRSQHVAMVTSWICLSLFWAIWIIVRKRRMRPALARIGAVLTFLALVYVACVYLPRPVAAIRVPGPDWLAIDFHSHTFFSADANRDFTPEANRAWHRACGYHAAYVTDHNALAGYRIAEPNNPHRSGDDVVLMPGEELTLFRQNLLILGNRERIANRFFEKNAADTSGLLREVASWDDVLLSFSLPSWAGPEGRSETPAYLETGVGAFEIVKGDPVSLDVPRGMYASVPKLAGRRHMSMISGTDNHGYGCATASWSLMHLVGWRSLSARQLHHNILSVMKQSGPEAVYVVTRYGFVPADSPEKTWAILPLATIGVLRDLNPWERISWMGWIWAIPAVRILRRKSDMKLTSSRSCA